MFTLLISTSMLPGLALIDVADNLVALISDVEAKQKGVGSTEAGLEKKSMPKIFLTHGRS